MTAFAKKDMAAYGVAKVTNINDDISMLDAFFAALEERGKKFNGSSHLQYRTQFRRVIREMTFDVIFKPAHSVGLILFASKNETGTGPYISMQLNKTVQFVMNTGYFKILLRYIIAI